MNYKNICIALFSFFFFFSFLSFSDYLLAIMARFCVVVIAVCCLVTGSCGDDDAAGRYTRLVAGMYPVVERYSSHLVTRYTQLVAGIAHML